MKVAFVGLGNMGLPMARNMVKAGYEVYGLNRSPGKEQAFRQAGGRTGRSLQELAGEVDVLVTCLPLPRDVEEVYLGAEGVVQNGRRELILIDFSTVSPGLNRKIAAAAAQAGMAYMDAPVSGGTVGAEQGTLSVMAGGERRVFDAVLPLLQSVGRHIYHVGDVGSGSVVKLINQLMVGIHTQSASEAMLLGEAMGVSKDTLYEILKESFAQSRIYDRHYSQFVKPDTFEPGFGLKLLHKDLGLVRELAAEQQASLPVSAHVYSLFSSAMTEGFGEMDMSSIYLYAKQRNDKDKSVKHYAVLLSMKDPVKSVEFRPQHLAFLDRQREAGRLFANGRFADGWGGMVIYRAESEEQVRSWVEQDPYVIEGARSYDIHEWELVRGHL